MKIRQIEIEQFGREQNLLAVSRQAIAVNAHGCSLRSGRRGGSVVRWG